MSPDEKEKLLNTTDVRAFLVLLRGQRTLREVASMLKPFGGPAHRGSVQNYECGRRSIGSAVQLAYCLAFGLDPELRLQLQRLAGVAAGCSPESQPEAA